MALAAIIVLVPWAAIAAAGRGEASPQAWIRIVFFAASPLLIGCYFAAVSRLGLRQQTQALAGTSQVAWSEVADQSAIKNLRKHFPVIDSVMLCVRGNPERIVDPGGPLLVSPRSFLFPEMRLLVFPAVLWKRLQQHPEALSAVLAHELAHFAHRDMEWLRLAKRLLRVVALLFFIAYVLDMAGSIQFDAADGFEFAVVQASLGGKVFTFSGVVTLILMVAYIRTLDHWREALADNAAVKSTSEAALSSAEALVLGVSSEHSSRLVARPSQWEREAAFVLSWQHWLMLGAVIVVASTYIIGPFAYLQQWNPACIWIAGFLANALPYVGYLLVFNVVVAAGGSSNKQWGFPGSPALYLVLGGALGFVLSQAVPLALTSVMMPEGYDYVLKHDPGALLLQSFLGSLGSNGWLALLALVGVSLGLATGYRSLSWCPGLVWAALSLIEQAFFPELMLGMVTPLVIAAPSLVIMAFAYRQDFLSAGHLSLPVVALASIYWVGVADINHLAASASEAAARAENRGDLTLAIGLHRRAALHVHGLAEPELKLVAALTRAGKLDAALPVAERAVGALFTSSWQDRFTTLQITGDLYLTRRAKGDLAFATARYQEAEQLWRNNSRLPRKQVALMLYNKACAIALQNGSLLVAISGLIEALALDSSLATSIIKDDDLRVLELAARPSPSPALLREVIDLNDMSAPAVLKLAKNENADWQSMAAVLATLAHHFSTKAKRSVDE